LTTDARIDDEGLEALLEYLKRTRRFDFTAYKRPSLARRIQRRMQDVSVPTFADYTDYLEVHPLEFPQLFDTILINVTAFFRDPPAWEFLARNVIPRILQAKKAFEPIRIWSAGCASGEEAYSVTMLFAEALGGAAFRDRVKVYASNVDEGALAKARLASYAPSEVEGVPAPLLEKYFTVAGDRFVFDKELRRSVIFGRHDLVQDAPISRIDLLVCRNTLMYFNADAQAKILSRFYFALNEGGYLFLGKAEMLLNHGEIFEPFDLRRRIFVKVSTASSRARMAELVAGTHDEPGTPVVDPKLRETAMDQSTCPELVVQAGGTLAFANDPARQSFGLTSKDIGRPLQELDVARRPTDLSAVIAHAYGDRRASAVRDVLMRVDGNERFYDVAVIPLYDSTAAALGCKIIFAEVTRSKRVEDTLQQLRQELETTREELETTNEELQSTNEELETTNEELQSTNEELETMNEELQSSNEELRTMNDEIIRRGEELNDVNAFLESILTSLQSAVIVVDRELRVTVWNSKAQDLWGLRAEEVRDEHVLNLDIGLPLERLRQPLRACLANEEDVQELTFDATNRRGKAIRCTVRVTPLRSVDKQIRGAILLMEEAERLAPLAEGVAS
jgi:two-component system, chemotaxis family, CheB/CheR fusion protein